MDIFNRLFIVVLALGALAAAAVLLIVAGEIVSPADISPDGWLRDQLLKIDELDGDRQTSTIVAVVAAALIAVVLLVLEARPLFAVEKLIVADAGGKEFGIYADSIKQIIAQSGLEIVGVTSVVPTIRKGAEGLRISCKATLVPSASMPEISSQLQEKVKAAVERLSGAAVADVVVKLRYEVERPRRPGRVS